MPDQPTTRAEQRLATRAAILAAATRLFLRYGVEATSIHAVAAELALTKGAVYANFPSKLALVEAVAQANSSSPDSLAVLLRADLSLRERLRRLGQELMTRRFSRELVLLDLEYVIYAARNRHWAKATGQRRQTALQDLAGRLRKANRARGERLPLGEQRFLELVLLVGRGIIQRLAVEPGSLDSIDVEAMLTALAPRRAGPGPAGASRTSRPARARAAPRGAGRS